MAVETAAAPAPARHGWLFHVDARNVVATHWEPLLAGEPNRRARGEGRGASAEDSEPQAAAVDGGGQPPAPGSIIGFRVRLFETEGRGGRVHLRSFRTPTSARRTDFQGQATGDLAVEGDRISLDLGGFEWMQVEARW